MLVSKISAHLYDVIWLNVYVKFFYTLKITRLRMMSEKKRSCQLMDRFQQDIWLGDANSQPHRWTIKIGGEKRNYIEKIKENLRGKREITLKKNSGNVLQA
jgi:hypothetical protein